MTIEEWSEKAHKYIVQQLAVVKPDGVVHVLLCSRLVRLTSEGHGHLVIPFWINKDKIAQRAIEDALIDMVAWTARAGQPLPSLTPYQPAKWHCPPAYGGSWLSVYLGPWTMQQCLEEYGDDFEPTGADRGFPSLEESA